MPGEEGILDTTIRQPASCIAAESHVRYEVLGMSFLMAFLMYMERGAIGAAAPSIMREFQIDKITTLILYAPHESFMLEGDQSFAHHRRTDVHFTRNLALDNSIAGLQLAGEEGVL